MKNRMWVALLFLLAMTCTRVCSANDSAFMTLWKRHLAQPEIQSVLAGRDKSNESESVRSRLDRLVEGDTTNQEKTAKMAVGMGYGDSPVPDYSPAGGYGAYDVTGPYAWRGPSGRIGTGGGATIGAGIGSWRKSETESSEVRRSNAAADNIRKILLHDAKLMQHNVRTATWELRTLEDLERAIADGDKSEITKSWLEKSQQAVSAAEQALAAQTGLSVEEIAHIVRNNR